MASKRKVIKVPKSEVDRVVRGKGARKVTVLKPAKPKPTLVSAAVLTIRDADKMTAAGMKRIQEWLRKQAKHLQKYGKHYSPKFRARYLYPQR